MGVVDGIAFVNTTTMQVVQVIPGPTGSVCSPNTRWRDIVTYQNYCYAVSECSGTNDGMMIMDMSFLPDSVVYLGSFTTGTDVRSHNLSIDTASGYAYVVKQNYSGIRVISLASPTSPVEVSVIPLPDCHDMFARNDTVWASEGSASSWSVWDLSVKTSPQMIARINFPDGGYSHNIWPSGDGNHVVTTQETASRTVKIWGVQNYASITLDGEYLAPSGLAHNVQMVDDTAYIAHYESGLAIVDFSFPAGPIIKAVFDTYGSSEGPSFNGAWGAFPYTTTGKTYVSNIDGRLYILEEQYYLINDTLTGDSIFGQKGTSVRVDLSVNNSQLVERLIIPFQYAGDLNLTFDSASTQGLRTEHFGDPIEQGTNPVTKQMAFKIEVPGGSGQELQPGNGPVMSLFFRISNFPTGTFNDILITPMSSIELEVFSGCFSYQPDIVPGLITLGEPPCCDGIVGNVDDSINETPDLSDLGVMVDFLFLEPGTVTLPCIDESDMDLTGGPPEFQVDLADLGILVDYLFLPPGSVTLQPCP
jgi:choice-of-anchor B domain-containing protein